MKTRELLLFTFWISIPLVMILTMLLAGCTPAEIRESEVIAEKAIEYSIEEDLKDRK